MATVNYSWTLPTVGASVNTWGTLLNTIIDDIDAKMVSKTATQTLTNKTLTAPVINGFTGDTSVINIGSGQLVKDASGNLGVGGAGSNNYRLEVTGNTQAKNTIGQTYQGVAASSMWIDSAGAWSLGLDSANGATARVKVDAGGNLLVGTTTGYTSGSGNAQLILPSALIASTTGVDVTAFATGCYQDTYGGAWKHRGNWVASKYEQGSQHRWYVDRGTYGAGTAVSFDQAMTLDNAGNLLVGTFVSSSFHRLVKNNPGDWAASIRNTSGSNPYGLTVNFEGVTGGAGQFFISCQDDTARFRVLGNGNVQNINNSYGSISSKEYKVNIVDTTPKLAKLLKYRVVNYSLKDDPDQLKQIGLIWEELYEISPGLCEETPEFADVEIEPARTEIKVTQRQKTRTEESTRYEVLLVDGQWTKLPVRTEVQVPLFDLHPLFEQDGSPVMEVAEPAIEASPALYDKDGNEVTPSVEAKPAVMRQVMLQVPVMEDVQETVEIPAKTERRPTGKTIKSVKYSVLVPMLVKAMQEQQAQIEELKAKVGA